MTSFGLYDKLGMISLTYDRTFFEVEKLDKYEYNLKLDQMKSLCAEENYESAAEIADTINWSKIKNVNALVKAGEIYEKIERYEESKDIFLMAYDRSPIGRTIIFRLAEVAIKMQDFDSATEYYKEFVEIAPHDNLRYVIQYDMKKAQGASLTELIPILEELKELEYTEEWAYELAYLYHKSGQSEKCVDACDELILWFGEGPYVERALELKMLYQPLSKAQEEKYRKFRLQRKGITSIGAEEMKRAGEYIHEDVEIPQVDVTASKYNTVNLQKELAKNIQQIMDATEKETVADTMDNIKKIVEDIPYLQINKEEPDVAEDSAQEQEENKVIDDTLRMNFQEMLEETTVDHSGEDKEQEMVEKQITGQITIADVLGDWEKTKRAAEVALQKADQQKLASAKAKALQEAGDIMERLNDVIPKLDAGLSPQDILAEEYLQKEPELPMEEAVPEEVAIPMEEADIPMEEADIPMEEADIPMEEADIPMEEADIPMEEADIPMEEADIPMKEEISEELAMPEEAFSPAISIEVLDDEPQEEISNEEEVEEAPPVIEPILIGDLAEELLTKENTPETELTAQRVEVEPEPVPEPDPVPDADLQKTKPMSSIREFIQKKIEEEANLPEVELPDDLEAWKRQEDTSGYRKLTEEQKAVFSYFVPVSGMEHQLSLALEGIAEHLKKKESAYTGNLIIQGGHGCGKTVLATSMIKALQKETGKPGNKVGKIDAATLNKKDIQMLLKKVQGGCLIIENAGALNKQTAVALSLLLEHEDSGILIVLEDTTKGIKRALALDDGFAKKFSEQITVPIFTNDDLVAFAKSYSEELGYMIDDLAILALYNRISNIQKLDQATTLTEVKEIVDEAIDREAHGGLHKFFNILTAKRYSDDDRIILEEKDFE